MNGPGSEIAGRRSLLGSAARVVVSGAVTLAVMGSALPGCTAPASPWADAQHDTTRGWQDPLLDRFAGTWVLQGMIAGGDVVHDVVAEWVTGHQYLRFTELSREREPDGTRAYEAIVIIGWDEANERYACLWLDSTGGGGLVNGIIGYAEPDGDRLAFLFEGGDESRFHTTLLYHRERDVWEWRMDSERDGGFKPFARAEMTRRDGTSG
ncbi:MAG: hypothetical protein ACYTG2_14430 [Planctomycetota bacterium]|jgi:hypothetical protein